DHVRGRAHPRGGVVGPALGEAGAARRPVVDEDRRLAGVLVPGGGEPAGVPAVAGGQQRQPGDGRVVGGVQPPGPALPRDLPTGRSARTAWVNTSRTW